MALAARLAFSILLVFTLPASAQTDRLLDELSPQGYVSDYAGVFAPDQRRRLEDLLEELDAKAGAQIAVVVVPSLDGGEIQDFSARLFERWGIGTRGEDRGILFLTVLEERSVRIEVGYGLEGLIPDARAGRLLDESVLPHFRENRYGDGIASGAAALAAIVAQDANVELTGTIALPGPAEPSAPGGSLGGIIGLLILLAVIALFFKNPWLALMLLNSMGRGGFGGGGFGRGGSGRRGGFGGGGFGRGGMSGGAGAGRRW